MPTAPETAPLPTTDVARTVRVPDGGQEPATPEFLARKRRKDSDAVYLDARNKLLKHLSEHDGEVRLGVLLKTLKVDGVPSTLATEVLNDIQGVQARVGANSRVRFVTRPRKR